MRFLQTVREKAGQLQTPSARTRVLWDTCNSPDPSICVAKVVATNSIRAAQMR